MKCFVPACRQVNFYTVLSQAIIVNSIQQTCNKLTVINCCCKLHTNGVRSTLLLSISYAVFTLSIYRPEETVMLSVRQ